MEKNTEKLTLTVYGAGYVGLVTAACLATFGYQVCVVDINQQRIAELNIGKVPIYEPGLGELIAEGLRKNNLTFTTAIKQGVEFGLYQFIAVGTPSAEDGSANLSFVYEVAKQIGQFRSDYCVVINKSTVPVGTGDRVYQLIQQTAINSNKPFNYAVVSNPEFLKEGSAIQDFMQPDRIVIGAEDERALELMHTLYQPFTDNNHKIVNMNIRSAELTKYAANAMLATKISFINEMSQIAERVGADIGSVKQGMSLDNRIGPHFINPGCGYGGSCFPKDIRALLATAQQIGYDPVLLKSVEQVNVKQKQVLFQKINRYFNQDLTNKVIAVWGLAFKPNTDDMRDAASIDLIRALLNAGAIVKAYDPIARKEAEKLFVNSANFKIAATAQEALEDADTLAIVTEWPEFAKADLTNIKAALRKAAIFDGRNLFEPAILKRIGMKYFAIGRGDH